MNNNSILDEYSGLTINRLLSENSMNVINIYKNERAHKLRRKIIKEILLKAEERNKLVKKKKSSLCNSIDEYLEKKIPIELCFIDKTQNNKKIDK
ncbi:hypothetical protein PMLGA01_030024200 [Plasmodium malariae]|uniref:Uncharacterized protein n=1 Tax=Plasmodium malariae TaxID=5858 RepID=A0A1C3KAK0_PLAMA|nr:hypothetical protein PMLGA01_030024200 [Plasmodium malariae]